jgi:diguanylate cyclase (GGDEF)-like protein
VLGIVLALGAAWQLGRHIVRRLRAMGDIARASAAGDLTLRHDEHGGDEIAALGHAFNEMADSLGMLVFRLEAEAQRDGFGSQLVEAFEMADQEAEAYQVVERSMALVSAAEPMELLLADSSRAHLQRVATNPAAGAPGCPVGSPFSCVAVRRGNPVVFPTSTALNACPRLKDRPDGDCSAVCVPVTFMGKALGVLHTTGPESEPPTREQVAQLTALATQAGSRIGTLRATQTTQLQASTDALTGLINRRTFENEARALLDEHRHFALAMADLDHFKVLNDTHGHQIGDRALRLFARTVHDAIRAEDLVARWGGEEFVLAFPGATAAQAGELLDRLRVMLAAATATGDTPAFTVSFGLTDSTAAGTLDQLVGIADRALMTAKQQGRNRVVIAEHQPASNSSTVAAVGE